MSDSLVGRTLADRYLVERLIGEGGMGAVYAARQLGLDREVAIKVLRPEIASGAVEAERFRREALAAARLDHPNIVKVYDFGRAPDGSAFLVMELLTGPSLEAWLGAASRPDPETVVGFFEPVCHAIDALHAAGIVHRDIKPANIALPDPANPDDVVRLIDLGIARFADAAKGDLTGRLIIGTAEYIAPEVAVGNTASPASDVYALAVTAFEALAGAAPFTGESDREVLIEHIKAPVPAITGVRPDLPEGFDAVFACALAKAPGERYASARELGRALRAALATPVRAPVATARRRGPRPVLLVEGDAEAAASARACLEALGYEVTEARDAFEALMRLGGRSFDLVVTNAQLPGLDGATFLRLKTEKGVATPTVLLTAGGALPEGVSCATHGVDAVAPLPVELPTLMDAVFRALNAAPPRAE